jgi:transcriptional regulator with XRE-family HTH domain
MVIMLRILMSFRARPAICCLAEHRAMVCQTLASLFTDLHIPATPGARALGISPANLFEILKGKHSPNAEVALHIEEILRNDMTIDKPKTLDAAKDRIEALTAELEKLKAAGKATLPTGNIQNPLVVTPPKPAAPAQPSVAPKPAAAQLSGAGAAADDRNIGMRFNAGPPLAELSPIDQLRAQLNAEKDSAKRQALYRKN